MQTQRNPAALPGHGNMAAGSVRVSLGQSVMRPFQQQVALVSHEPSGEANGRRLSLAITRDWGQRSPSGRITTLNMQPDIMGWFRFMGLNSLVKVQSADRQVLNI